MVTAPGEQVHATNRDEVFLCVGDEDRRLDFEQRIQLRYDRGDTSFERTTARVYGDPELDFVVVNMPPESATLTRNGCCKLETWPTAMAFHISPDSCCLE